MGSAEYFAARGGGTASGFLAAVYQDALGRAVDPSGFATYSTLPAQGRARTMIVQAVLTSVEGYVGLAQGMYQQMLHRWADSSSVTAAVLALRSRTRSSDLLAALLGSGVFFTSV